MRLFRGFKGLFGWSKQPDTVIRSPHGKGLVELPKIPAAKKDFADFEAKPARSDDPTVSKVKGIAYYLLKLPKYLYHKIFRGHKEAGVPWKQKANKPSTEAEKFLIDHKGANPRVLFHIHADMFGDNSKLQGSHHKQTYGYLLKYLKTQEIGQVDSELIKKLDDTHKLISGKQFVGDALALTTKAFGNNTSVFIPGGWMGKPAGHAINYELIPEADGTCTMRFYNLGAGSNHFALEATGSKLRGPAFSEWAGIPRENILNSEFFTAIGEMNGFVPESQGEEYNEEDVFALLKGMVKPAEERPGVNAPIMSLQQSGVCAWRSLMAVMRSHMSEKDYKRMVIDIKLQSLKEHVKLLSDKKWRRLGTTFRNTEENLVFKSAVKLARTLSKGIETEVITHEYAEEQITVLQQIISGMKKRGLQIESPFDKPKFRAAGVRIDEESPLTKSPISLEQAATKGGTVSKTPWANLYSKIAATTLETFGTFNANVDQLLDLCKQAEGKGDFAAIHIGLLDAVKSGNPEVFDDKSITPEQAQNLIVQLKKVSDHYLRSCFGIEGGDKIYAESYYVLLKVLHWQGALSIQAGYGLQCSVGPVTTSSFHTRFYDSIMCAETVNMERAGRGAKLLLPTYKWEQKRGVGKGLCWNYDHNGLEDFLRKNYPDALKDILKNDHNIAKVPKSLRSFALLCSPKVPEWIGAFRDSCLNFSHIDAFPIAQTAPPSLEVQYKFKLIGDGRKGGEIIATRRGVTNRLLENSPHQKYIQSNLLLRYCAAHRIAKSSAIRNFIDVNYDQDFRSVSEEDLITIVKMNKIKEMSEEEDAELVHIFVKKSLQWSHLAEYFTKYSEKLLDPDYQTLFNMALFDHLAIDKVPQEHRKKLESLIDLQQSEALLRGDIQLYTFLSEVKRRLGKSDAEEKLRELVKNPELANDEKGIVWAELAAHLSEKTKLKNDELTELAEARAYLEANPLSKDWEDPQVMHVLEQGMVRHAAALDAMLTKDPDVVQRIIKRVFPSSSEAQWSKLEPEGSYPAWKSDDGQALYFPLKGRFVFPGMMKTLPSEIRENSDFIRLFKGVSKAAASSGGDVWIFEDPKGVSTHVKLATDGSLNIQQNREGRWVEYIPPSLFDITLEPNNELRSIIGSRYLHESQLAFRDVSRRSHLMLCDPKTRKSNYYIKLNHNRSIRSVKRKDGLRLGAATNTAFEDPEFVHYWYKEKTLDEVEFSRFGLTFSGPDLSCTQMRDWKWRPDRTVAALKHFTDALVLRDAKGNEKVILPNQNFDNLNTKDLEALEPCYSLDRKTGQLPVLRQQYCLYEIDKKGRLMSNKRSDNLHLALTLTVAQNYRQAAKLLQRWGNKLSAFTPEEHKKCKNILETKTATGDTSADASALQVYAGIRLLRQSDKMDEKLLGTTLEVYQTWLAKKGLTTCLSLSKEDEIYLLKTALVKDQQPVFLNRLAELDPAAAARIPIKNQVEEVKTYKPRKTFAPLINWDRSKPPSPLLTRPEVLFSHFLYYKEQIICGDKKTIAWVEGALPHLACMEKGGWLARIYLAMIKEPKLFADISLGGGSPLQETIKLEKLIKAAEAVDVDLEGLYQKLKTPLVTRKPKAAATKAERVVKKPSLKVELIESWSSKSYVACNRLDFGTPPQSLA